MTAWIFLSTCVALPQSTSYLSTLSNSNDGGETPVASDQWAAELFQTGTASDGYVLDSIQLMMGEADGNANGFNVSLYSNNNIFPGNNLGVLNGSTNPSSGIYTYTASNLILSPATSYWIVVNAETPYSTGGFYLDCTLSYLASYSSSDNWSIPGGSAYAYAVSSNGSSWGIPGVYYALFTINATVVPEPEIHILAGLGLIAILLRRRK